MDMKETPETPAIAPKNASWGAIISIVVILAMIVIGAMYAWGKRVDEQKAITQPTVTASTSVQY